jgi:hypothetical protein
MMERTRTLLLAGIAVCGLLIVALSFLPWVRFTSVPLEASNVIAIEGQIPDDTSITISGAETSRLRDLEVIGLNTVKEEDGWCSCRVGFGDGFITAAMGLVLVAAAGLALLAGRDRPAAALSAGASLSAMILAGLNAIADWQALAWTQQRHLEAVDGTVQPALIALVAAGAAGAVLAAAAWTLAPPAEEWDEDEWADFEGEDFAAEGGPAWA